MSSKRDAMTSASRDVRWTYAAKVLRQLEDDPALKERDRQQFGCLARLLENGGRPPSFGIFLVKNRADQNQRQ